MSAPPNNWEDQSADDLSNRAQNLNLNNQQQQQQQYRAPQAPRYSGATFTPGAASFTPGAASFVPGQAYNPYGQYGAQQNYPQYGGYNAQQAYGQQGYDQYAQYGYNQQGGQQYGGYQQQQQGAYVPPNQRGQQTQQQQQQPRQTPTIAKRGDNTAAPAAPIGNKVLSIGGAGAAPVKTLVIGGGSTPAKKEEEKKPAPAKVLTIGGDGAAKVAEKKKEEPKKEEAAATKATAPKPAAAAAKAPASATPAAKAAIEKAQQKREADAVAKAQEDEVDDALIAELYGKVCEVDLMGMKARSDTTGKYRSMSTWSSLDTSMPESPLSEVLSSMPLVWLTSVPWRSSSVRPRSRVVSPGTCPGPLMCPVRNVPRERLSRLAVLSSRLRSAATLFWMLLVTRTLFRP